MFCLRVAVMTAGRPRFGAGRRVRLCISVDPATAEQIDKQRGPLSAGQWIDRLVAVAAGRKEESHEDRENQN
jgi:hypothetical protein